MASSSPCTFLNPLALSEATKIQFQVLTDLFPNGFIDAVLAEVEHCYDELVTTGSAAMDAVFIDSHHNRARVVELFFEQLCVIAMQRSFHHALAQSRLLFYLIIAQPIGSLLRNGIVEQLISPLPFHQPNMLTELEKALAATSACIPFNLHS